MSFYPKDSVHAYITRGELAELCTLRMTADPLPAAVDVGVLDDFLNRAADQMGFPGGWVQAYHQAGGPR